MLLVGLSLGACAQIIGLDTIDDEDDESSVARGGGGLSGGGTSGKGGKGGSGGDGTAGESGPGGDTGVGGEGGSGVGGEGGSAGSGVYVPDCATVTEITASFFSVSPDSVANDFYHYYMLSSSLGSTALPDFMAVAFYAPAGAGDDVTIDLAGAPENNYATCSHCVYLEIDVDTSDMSVSNLLFAASGTIEIAAGSEQVLGSPNVTLSDVTLVEATIAPATFETTFAPNPQCLHLTSATLSVSAPTWTCDPATFADGALCDCGCGVGDLDCADATAGVCDSCDCTPDLCSDIDSSQCVPVGWECDPSWENDGSLCDCGCGTVDPDCPSALATDCDYFLCGSGNVVADNNALCDGWTCSTLVYNDGVDCDCGCGTVDPDCIDENDTCDFCNCALGTCSVPNNVCGWTCSFARYGDGSLCDCGCGVLDPDCLNASANSCDRCWCPGEHEICTGAVVSNDNSSCL